MGVRHPAMEGLGVTPALWSGRRVLVTGHTGFKGAWLARWLARAGAEVTGLALPPDPGPNLCDMLGNAHLAASHLIDLRDAGGVRRVIDGAKPQVVLHLAAQPLVRRSFADPVETFGSNLMGTVHLLDALRHQTGLAAVLVVTSDKVYANDNSGRAYGESDRLGGHDPYSASKAATEIAVASFADSYFTCPVVTARGGNVVGGGDFAADRLIPDIVRAAMAGQKLVLRNPASTRPWQHVLDCLSGYIAYAEALLEGDQVPSALNFGPPAEAAPLSVAQVASAVQAAMGLPTGWQQDPEPGPPEMAKLSINPGLAMETLGWRQKLDAAATTAWIAEWYGAYRSQRDVAALTDAQIARYEELPA